MAARKINTIEALRDHAIDTLERLASGDIDTTEAGVTGKLCENVISTIKAQLEYARLIDEAPEIPFMQNSHSGKPKALEGTVQQKSLPAPKR